MTTKMQFLGEKISRARPSLKSWSVRSMAPRIWTVSPKAGRTSSVALVSFLAALWAGTA